MTTNRALKRTKHRAGANALPIPPELTQEQTVTTIALRTDIWIQLKIRAAHERRTVRDVCQRAIEDYLRTPFPPVERS